MNEIIADENDINDEIFWDYLTYQNPSFLAKDLIRAKQDKNEQLVNDINDELIDLRNAIIKKEIPENENTNKLVDIIEKILDSNKQQKGKGLEIITPKKMLQRLPITLARVKAVTTSEDLLNEIRQIIYSLYRAKEVNKKVYNNIMN